MIDLKTVKNITISEGSVTKITNSSGVVLWQKVVAPSSSLDIDLNNQWVDSTKTLDGYLVYMSNSNYNVNNGYASMKFKFKGMPDFKIWINSYAESNYDYTIAWNLDVDFPTSIPTNISSGAKASTNGNQYNPTNITAFTEVDYPNDGGEHFVVVTYRKDGSAYNYDDRGYVAVRLTLLSTTWVVSSTEFVKKDGKYYERINEVGTYVGGLTALTGNYKEGNELAVTYKQGSADDYMVVGSGMYYKKYAYVTPVNTEINTGDYIQGDYIGEATLSMKVTYADNTEKTFYNLTSIKRDTDPNKANAKEVVLSNSVTEIGDSAFEGSHNLTSITLPTSLTTIGSYAFIGCWSLTDIIIPNNVTSIDYKAFYNCSSLTGITISRNVVLINDSTFEGCDKLTSVVLPESVATINAGAFNGCSSLSSVTIENSASKLTYNNYAFGRIASTAKLYVPSNLLSDYQSDSNWTGAFGGGIFAIQIPAMKVTYTDNTEKTFYDLTSIDQNTDSNKANAKKVEIYSGVKFIGSYSFQKCTNLTEVTIPESVTSIGWAAFINCTSLPTVTIPGKVTFDQYAFKSCTNLASVTIEFSEYKLTNSNKAFNYISPTAKLYVPSNLVSSYQKDKNWSDSFRGGIFAIGS